MPSNSQPRQWSGKTKAFWLVLLALLGVTFVTAGSASAAAKSDKALISGKDIKRESITGKNIKNGTVTKRDLTKGVQKSLDRRATNSRVDQLEKRLNEAVGTNAQLKKVLSELAERNAQLEKRLTELERQPGPQGPAGPQGPQGDKGDVGPAGPKGDTGAEGADGKDGQNGLNGKDGADGKDGVDGAKGDDGPQGPQGPQGDDGVTGPQGPAGPQGPQGDKGDPGQNADGSYTRKVKQSGDYGVTVKKTAGSGGNNGSASIDENGLQLGVASPGGGFGGAYLTTYSPADRPQLSSIKQLAYEYSVANRVANSVAPTIKIDVVNACAPSSTCNRSTTLVLEPYYTVGGLVTSSTVDGLNAATKWWSTQPIVGAPNRDTFVPLSTILANNPDARISRVYIEAGQNSQGPPWANTTDGFAGSVSWFRLNDDKFVFGTS